MNIGVVGCGKIAHAHVKALSKIEDVSTFLLYDVDSKNVDKISSITGKNVIKVTSLNELANSSDCFLVCTPNHTHKDVIEKILEVNKIPFICEKPLASTLTEAEQIERIASKNSIISFNYRYNNIVREIKDYIRVHDLGRCVFFSATFNKNSAVFRKEITWRDSDIQSSSSGALGDLSCHLLDCFCWLLEDKFDLNTVRIVKGTRVKLKQGGEVKVDDNGYIVGSSCSGIFFKIKASKSERDPTSLGLSFNLLFDKCEIVYSSQYPDQFTVVGLDDFNEQVVRVERLKLIEDPDREIPYWSDSFLYMHQEWISNIKHETKYTLPSLEDGLRIQEVLELITQTG